jgi:hypothetical protein
MNTENTDEIIDQVFFKYYGKTMHEDLCRYQGTVYEVKLFKRLMNEVLEILSKDN